MLRVLFFVSNPISLKALEADAEYFALRDSLLQSESGAAVDTKPVRAGTLSMLTQQIRSFKPNILHYAGHATEKALIVEGDARQEEELSAENLATIIQLLGTGVRCLFLNACYTAAQAEQLLKHVPFFIGMQTAIPNSVAKTFSQHFYLALSAGDELGKAFELARSALGAHKQIPKPAFWDGADNLPMVRSVRIFCLYASKEQGAYEDLETWLALYLRAGLVELAGSRSAPVGADPEPFNAEQINTADIILCFTSPEFAADKKCNQMVAQAMRRRQTAQTSVIDLRIRPFALPGTLDSRKPLPRDESYLSGAKNRDLWWQTTVDELIAVVRDAENKLLDRDWEPCLKRTPVIKVTEPAPQDISRQEARPPAPNPEPPRTERDPVPQPAPTRSLGFLHLSDLHQGMDAAHWLWPGVRQSFFKDLEAQYKKSGPWDVIFFTGDLTQRGSREEFEKLEQTLERVRKHLKDMGSSPQLLTVPGNHDLVRPAVNAPVRVLRHWKEDPELRNSFFESSSDLSRKAVAMAFEPYTQWVQRNAPFKNAVQRTEGLLPGDFSVSLVCNGLRLGVVGLNSAFLQLEGGDYKGRLHLDVQQLHVACGGDAMDWLEQQDLALLLTHHPLSWLSEPARQHFLSEIYTPGRFIAHLHGHMHEPQSSAVAQGGGQLRHFFQGPSLFGLEEWEGSRAAERIHGYSAGRIAIKNGQGELRLWPRRMVPKADSMRGMDRDTSFHLDEDGALSMTFPIATGRA